MKCPSRRATEGFKFGCGSRPNSIIDCHMLAPKLPLPRHSLQSLIDIGQACYAEESVNHTNNTVYERTAVKQDNMKSLSSVAQHRLWMVCLLLQGLKGERVNTMENFGFDCTHACWSSFKNTCRHRTLGLFAITIFVLFFPISPEEFRCFANEGGGGVAFRTYSILHSRSHYHCFCSCTYSTVCVCVCLVIWNQHWYFSLWAHITWALV